MLDKRAMTYMLTCFHHHRCRFTIAERTEGSPKLIQYP
jgi:hypothetical protein